MIIVIITLSTSSGSTNSSTNSISNNEIKKDTYNEDIQKIKNNFILNEAEVIDSQCESLKNVLNSMLRTLISNDKIDSNWSPYSYSHYYEYTYDNHHYISFDCDINHIENSEDMKEIIKDCSQIIWESINLIYSNPNINNNDNKYFRELHFAFDFKYSYIDNYGNTKYDNHNLYFEISRYSYNSVNMETFPSILELDYTKIFGIGKATYRLGKQGIQIDFNNLLVK